MPRSSKPRKRYNPAKHANRQKLVSLDEAYRIFEPVRNILSTLRGEVEVNEAGYPIMKDWDGRYARVDYLLTAWAECWDRLFSGVDHGPIIRLANKLNSLSPIFEEDLQRVEALLDCQQVAMTRMRANDVSDKMDEKIGDLEIASFFEQMGLKEAA